LERIEERPESICLADPFSLEGKPRQIRMIRRRFFFLINCSVESIRPELEADPATVSNVTPVTAYWVSHALVTLAGRDFSTTYSSTIRVL
jgi:hypothetical protein